jgi:hypothetical protein
MTRKRLGGGRAGRRWRLAWLCIALLLVNPLLPASFAFAPPGSAFPICGSAPANGAPEKSAPLPPAGHCALCIMTPSAPPPLPLALGAPALTAAAVLVPWEPTPLAAPAHRLPLQARAPPAPVAI